MPESANASRVCPNDGIDTMLYNDTKSNVMPNDCAWAGLWRL